MSTHTSTRSLPTAKQKVYYLYLAVRLGAEWLKTASRSEVSAAITKQNKARNAMGLPYHELSNRAMMVETLAIVAEAAMGGDEQ